MKNQLKNVHRLPNKLYEYIIKKIGKFNHPYYMKQYVTHLRKLGMDIKEGESSPIYIAVDVQFDGKDYSKIHIGKDVVISGGVRILTHDYSIARALQSIGEDMSKEAYMIRDVIIEDNSFIGARSILLPGTHIGKNCIIGAGSVVRGTISDNKIVFGNPAKEYMNTDEFAKKHLQKQDYFKNM